jgi:hypothetical protein
VEASSSGGFLATGSLGCFVIMVFVEARSMSQSDRMKLRLAILLDLPGWAPLVVLVYYLGL